MSLIANLFGYVLNFIFSICGNYGWSVIIFSVFIKAIIFPITLKQQASMKKNQELQPKLQALQEKYKDDQQQLSIEYQKFMKENKYNPFGGCLISILQIFVLIGILYVVSNPIKYMEKKDDATINKLLVEAIVAQDYSGDEEAFNNFAHEYVMKNSGEKIVADIIASKDYSGDVEIYTQVFKKTNRYHELKILKEEHDLNFLGIDLGDITAQHPSNFKLWIFPILTTVCYYISLWMISNKQKQMTQKIKDADGNEIEMPNMMTMNIIMPLMSGWISYSVPQGLGLYWFINSLLQIFIQIVSDKIVENNNSSSNTNNTKKEVVLKPQEAIKEEEINQNKENNNNQKNKQNSNSSKKKKKNKKK